MRHGHDFYTGVCSAEGRLPGAWADQRTCCSHEWGCGVVAITQEAA